MQFVSWKFILNRLSCSDFQKKIKGVGKLQKSQFFKSKTFWTFLNPKKRHISKTTRIWAAILNSKIRNPWEYSHNVQHQEWDLQRFGIFLYLLKFLKNFRKKHKNCHISKTTRIWQVCQSPKLARLNPPRHWKKDDKGLRIRLSMKGRVEIL